MVASVRIKQIWSFITNCMLIWGFRGYYTQGKVIRGELRTTENWFFLTRFCFLSEHGRFEYEVEYPKEYKTQNILLYYDEKNQWPSVYKRNKTCAEKESVLSVRNGQVIFLNETTFGSGCIPHKIGEDGDHKWLHCEHGRTFQSARERWWFIGISNCYTKQMGTAADLSKFDKGQIIMTRRLDQSISETGLYLKYRITMTNDNKDLWFKHFSADELYILQVDIGFFVLYLMLLLASMFEAHALRSRHLLHKTYVLYIASVILECSGLAFLCASYALYAQEGEVNPAYKLIGKALEATSTLLLLILLLLIAKGYTVTRGRLKSSTTLKVGILMCFYIVFYVILFFYEQTFFDPGQVLYIYESPAGYGLIGLRVVGWSWFVYATIVTMIHYPEKSNFYTKMFLLYSLWFLSGPVVILISTFIVPKWMREKILNGVELFISIKAHFIFFVLTRPSISNKNFPYHVRTTQIDVMRHTNGIAGDSSLDRFSHHPYAISSPNCPTDYVTLFGLQAVRSSNTVEMVEQRPPERPTVHSNGYVK